LVIALVCPAPGHAQRDSLGLHATLDGWAEQAWLTILDRDAAYGGRLSANGILQRFHPRIDPDYEITKIRFRFDVLDDYRWYRRVNGARYAGGSNTTHSMAVDAEFKQSVSLGGAWSANAHYNKQTYPELERSLVRLGFARAPPDGMFEFIEATLTPLKPSADVEVGAGWRRGRTRATLSLAVLDAFNDLIYQGLGTVGVSPDTALDYERQPVMLRANLDIPLGARFRFEGHGGYLRPSLVRAYVQAVPDSGFRQKESYGFVGAMLEWMVSPRVTSSAFATYINAITDRQPLAYGRPIDDFWMTERTTRVGAHLVARLAPRWVFHTWVQRMWRPEWRVYRAAGAADVNYEDVSWSGQAELKYGGQEGLTLSTSLDVDERQVVRGAGQVPAFEPLGRSNHEMRVEFGWRFPTQTAFTLGLSIELDPGISKRAWFGGAQGRFVLYW